MLDVTDVNNPGLLDFKNENMFFALGHRRKGNEKEPKAKKVVTQEQQDELKRQQL
jgi:hypothetical protein